MVSATTPLRLESPGQGFPLRYFLNSKSFTPLSVSNALDTGSQPFLEQAAAIYTPKNEHATLLDAYFCSVHTWLPMISKKRIIYAAYTEQEACQDLLMLCMKLCTTYPSDATPAADPLYLTIRSLCSAAETAGIISLRLVQSLVLVTVYEISHAIYPVAYSTIGRAARLAALMGWHDIKAQQLFKEPDTLRLREEQRRTWWAVYILDRYINIDTSGLPFASPEPSDDELLPVNDHDWNQGRPVASEPLFASSFSSVTTLGSFAGTCQAAHILSKVIDHKRARKLNSQDMDLLLGEGRGLYQALSTLQMSFERQASKDEAPAGLALCIMARYLLQNMYACRDMPGRLNMARMPLETELQCLSVESLELISSTTVPRLAQLQSECPLLAKCFFEAAKLCGWAIREECAPATRDSLRHCVNGLRDSGRRYNVAGK